MEWKNAKKKGEDVIAIPERWLHLHYYEALNILFRAENALRVFVYVILKNQTHDKWTETMLQVTEEKQLTIAAASTARKKQAEGYGYLGYSINSPLMYLNSGELTRLIVSDSQWTAFKKHFKGTKEIIKTKFDEIGTVRNTLAHFRPIKIDDIELIKQNIKHAFLGIEECLKEVTTILNIVPTNTEADWYQSLSNLSNEYCNVQMYQSSREEWVRIEITYSCAILNKEQYWQGYYSYKVLNLISPAIVKLDEYSYLAKLCTYVMEHIPYTSMEKDYNPAFKKQTSLIYSKHILKNHHDAIKTGLQNLIAKIKEESNLIKEDNLARGTLIESIQTSASFSRDKDDETKGWWNVRSEILAYPFGENDPAEYWGDLDLLYQSDFIAGAKKYPWMPSDISSSELPF
ncbi:hypothetical protein FOG18_11075 [Legionella israelensis]|uniref:Swt1 family HEPN domain-containing protein n=1 Tax=Legionella israelensis TaxID=454 RepID=UPI00117D3E3A|nr:Swt1 family HEPN domain-containing protein [Legionella israelensis]QDP73067.1 hypothetical protein FOG18_11075 [Legionella israelensis]